MKWKEPSAGGSMSVNLLDCTKFRTALILSKGLSKNEFLTAEKHTNQDKIKKPI